MIRIKDYGLDLESFIIGGLGTQIHRRGVNHRGLVKELLHTALKGAIAIRT